MAFSLPKKAKHWFRHIRKGSGDALSLDFDVYYFCLMAGLSKGKKKDLPNSETTDIIQQFPKEYLDNRHMIRALFLKKELDFVGVAMHERNTLDNQLKLLIDPNSATQLSERGMKEINKYAFGGFQILQERFSEPPRTLDNFLLEFCTLIEN